MPGVKVLDVGQGISGPCCAKILAQMGAEVIKVEPPEGDLARQMGPFPGDIPHPEKSGLFLAMNANKQGITLDLSSPGDAEAFRNLAAGADIVIENPPPVSLEGHGLGYESLKNANPGLIFTSITPFGNRGPCWLRSLRSTPPHSESYSETTADTAICTIEESICDSCNATGSDSLWTSLEINCDVCSTFSR